MTTDQPTRCPLCASTFIGSHVCAYTKPPNERVNAEMVGRVRRDAPKYAGSPDRQPTPTSSLEEARKRLYDAASDYGSMDYDASKARREIGEAFIRGAEFARAEVIRGVEAALEDHEARLAQGDYWPTSAIQLVARLRALSQGGEANG